MISNNQYDWNAQRRSAIIVFWLSQGNKLTTAEVARLVGLSYRGALHMMNNISGAPLMIMQVNGKWQIGDKK